ncbi:hypothetical protein bcgnr5369_14930 [Bacillus cereus]
MGHCGYCHDIATFHCSNKHCYESRSSVCKSCGANINLICQHCHSRMVEEDEL